MSWYTRAYQTISAQVEKMKKEGITEIKEQMKLVSQHYPYGERKNYPYKAWLKAKKDYFLGPSKQGKSDKYDSSRLTNEEKKAQLKLF